MKSYYLALSVLLLPFISFAEYREWTAKVGVKIRAEFVSIEDGLVSLRKNGGSLVNVQLSALVVADQDYVLNAKYKYTPRNMILSFRCEMMGGRYYAREAGKTHGTPCLADSMTVIIDGQPNVVYSSMSLVERGTTMTNREEKAISTLGRFVCLNYTIDNKTDSIKTVIRPVIVDSQKRVHQVDAVKNAVDFYGCNCERVSDDYHSSLNLEVRPGIPEQVCDIFEIPKDVKVAEIIFYSLKNGKFTAHAALRVSPIPR